MFGGILGGGGSGQQPAAPAQPAGNQYIQQNSYNQQAQMAAAEQEMDMISDLFNRLSDACHKKCILQRYPDSELTKGESLCLDRCVSKFFQVNKEVGDVLTKISELNQK
ncbi:hypothetical protein BB559_002430 [Furculomyces boomerangus]|uniref:Mitochondrial import inner membrane translocase subunit n=2 Tax=Harpellales TaxID=61421 RepID=A0A2T9YCM1_9FUNG|nr:hypothetical protein BB559_004798 [Furculomyces boomerangus]PVU96272.1 hypothetical protein BB559_002430 [Furculomyces boomerangus]PVZ99313.1 hypothetical protein BB558_004690 [Smittium angustum]